MTGPRIGRSDVLAALRAPLRVSDTGSGRLIAPSYSLDDVAARARTIASSLARLANLTRQVRLGLNADDARRAWLDRLADRAAAMFHELERLAGEASGQSAPERDARIG